jgi:hypothetical protein
MSRTTAAVCGGTSNETPERVALLHESAGAGADLELVFLAVRQIRNEDLPDAARQEQPHRVHAAVPTR